MQIINLLGRIAVAVLLMHVVACRKPVTENAKESLSGINPFGIDYEDCRIAKIKWDLYYYPISFECSFSYNSAGNPTAVTYDTCMIYHPRMVFQYDAQERLKDYFTPACGGSVYEVWYQFRHDINGRIIGDTMTTWGNIVGGVPRRDPFTQTYAHYLYDSQDRIIMVTRHFTGTTHVENLVYSYNSSGNRLSRIRYYDGVRRETKLYGPYDDKINIRRSHKIWQFLAHDYSVNNPFTAGSYTEFNMPYKIRLSTGNEQQFLFGLYIDRSNITFQCKGVKL